MSDIERIIKYMRENGSITCKECEKNIGTTELRRRICDIKDMGYQIGDVWEAGENREGNPTRFKRYFIQKEPDCAVRAKKEPCEHPKKTITFWDVSSWDLFGGIYKLTRKIKRNKIKHYKKEKN